MGDDQFRIELERLAQIRDAGGHVALTVGFDRAQLEVVTSLGPAEADDFLELFLRPRQIARFNQGLTELAAGDQIFRARLDRAAQRIDTRIAAGRPGRRAGQEFELGQQRIRPAHLAGTGEGFFLAAAGEIASGGQG